MHCRHHIQKLGKHISFRKWFQPECKYNKSVRAFTAVRGRPFVEELTLEISNKLIRERDSWLLKLSLDFLNINEWCLSKKHSKSRHSFVIQFVLICLLLIIVSLASASIPGKQTGITGYIKPSLRPKKVPSHKVSTFKFCDECTARKNREDSKNIFTIIV